MTRKTKVILQYLFFFSLGFLFVWLSVKDIDAEKWGQIKFALSNARYALAIPVFLILIGSHYVRALRWRLLMAPLGYTPTRSNVFFAVMIGYLANQGVPRLGEVLKCTVLARYEKIPADKLVGTIILERMIDALCLLTVFGITLAIQPGLYAKLQSTVFAGGATSDSGPSLGSIIFYGVLVLLLLLLVYWMIKNKKRPADLVRAMKDIVRRVWIGLGAIRQLKRRGLFVLYTILIWILYLSGGYIGFQALAATSQYGLPEAFTVLSAGSIGMIITPGGIGGYPLLIEGTMMLYGLQQSIAAAFGWLLWIAQTTVILIGGLLSFVLLPRFNRRQG